MSLTIPEIDRSRHKQDGDMTVWEAVDGGELIYPFEGDTDNFLYIEPYEGAIDTWSEFEPTIGAPHPDIVGLYYVSNDGVKVTEAGYAKTNITWATLPGFSTDRNAKYFRTEGESFVWSKPGIVESTITTQRYITGLSNDATYTYLTYDSSGAFDVGDLVLISYTIYDPVNNWPYTRFVSRAVKATPAANQVAVDKLQDMGQLYFFEGATTTYYGSIRLNNIGRQPQTVVVPSTVYYDYFLEGLNCTSHEDIETIQSWKIYDGLGNETDTVTNESDNGPTSPSADEYRTMIANKERIVVEPSIVRRWRGNIWERATRYITIV